ncbi:hypothetical protein AAMO2058_001065400 [Amorphochlora amoebiformis]
MATKTECKSGKTPVVTVKNAGVAAVNGVFLAQNPLSIPKGFASTCQKMFWEPKEMWEELSDQKRLWFEAENGSYIYWNKSDGRWWIDGPSGAGVYIVADKGEFPPSDGWKALQGSRKPLPTVEVGEKTVDERGTNPAGVGTSNFDAA